MAIVTRRRRRPRLNRFRRKTIALVEGRLLDAEGRVLAKASASTRLIDTSKLTP